MTNKFQTYSFWYLAFKITQNHFSFKIEVFGKIFQFSNISENTNENLINFLDWFYFSLIFRHFIGLSRYFRLWKEMPQIKKLVFKKNSEIRLFLKMFVTWPFFTFYRSNFNNKNVGLGGKTIHFSIRVWKWLFNAVSKTICRGHAARTLPVQ